MTYWLVFPVVILVPMALLVGIVLAWRFIADRDRRRSPLNFKLLNQPGDGLRAQIEKHDEKMGEAGMVAVIAGPLMLAAWAVERLRRQPAGLEWDGRFGEWLFVIAAVIAVAWASVDFIRHARARRRYRQALEAERATAQNLIPLMAEGCVLFHDFPADGFNIDHVVVAPHMVFAVETKSRKKPATGGRDAARVVYDGRGLRFPTHAETKPVEQARRQAQWLQKFLTSATGEPVQVAPVLTLPGWYVELTKEGSRADVIVNNLRSPQFLLRRPAGFVEDPARQRRIIHALTERYPATDG